MARRYRVKGVVWTEREPFSRLEATFRDSEGKPYTVAVWYQQDAGPIGPWCSSHHTEGVWTWCSAREAVEWTTQDILEHGTRAEQDELGKQELALYRAEHRAETAYERSLDARASARDEAIYRATGHTRFW